MDLLQTTMSILVRPAMPADVSTILRFIHELAAFERAPDEVKATEADLLRDGWGLDPKGEPLPGPSQQHFRCFIAEWMSATDASQREAAGFALFFNTYSTWVGHHGIRLEDLYVTPPFRGRGIGKALLARLARVAVDEGCTRLEWDVLTWNEPALAVYRRLGASIKEDWHVMRLSGAALLALAEADILTG